MPYTLPPRTAGLTGGHSDEIVEGTGRSVPPGVEATIEYRGTYLNIREWLDTYLVTSIDGLADPDIRDSREVNPGNHGETAFSTFYGGRTIALTGKVRAHTLPKLRDMQQGLKQAFADVDTEYPLIFHGANPEMSVMIYCKKSAPLSMPETQGNFQLTRDFLITLRASNPRILSIYTKSLQFAGFRSDSFGTPATIVRTNWVKNPSYENGSLTGNTHSSGGFGTGGSASSAVVTDTTNGNVVEFTVTSAADSTLPYVSVISGASSGANVPTQAMPVKPSDLIALRALGKAMTALPSGSYFVARARYYNKTGDYLGERALGGSGSTPTVTDPAVGTWISLAGTDQVPATISALADNVPAFAQVRAYCYFTAGVAWSGTVRFDSYMVTETTSLDTYPANFNGNTGSSSALGYRWRGEFSNSFSDAVSNTGLNPELWTPGSTTISQSINESGQLQSHTTSTVYAYYKGFRSGLVNPRVAIKVTSPANTAAAAYPAVILKAKGDDAATLNINQLYGRVTFQGASSQLRLYAHDNTATGALLASSAVFTAAASTNYWLVGTMNGNAVTLSLFSVDPFQNPSATPVATVSHTLTGTSATALGDGVAGKPGYRTTQDTSAPDTRIDDWRADIFTGGLSGYIIGSVVNEGNYDAQPQVQISGPVTAPTVTFIEATTNKIIGALKFTGTIPNGSTWMVDIAKRTVQDQTGATQFDALSVNSQWPELVPGENKIQIDGTNMGTQTSFTVTYRNTWL